MERHKESEERLDLELDSKTELPISEREEKVSQSLEEAQDLREQGNYDQGIEKLINALALEVKKDQVYYRLGNIFFDSGDLDRAEYAYERAIEENEEHVNAQHNLAVVYRKQGKVSKSVKQRKKANKLELQNPKDPDLSKEEKSYAKRFALKLVLMIIGGIAGLGLIVYLAAVFVF
ncbi:tetratricopeptide repeat protein [Candidatus Bipolaricaulota bacterium]|nr:tetratricopeptide repeat protein [Candidatus Bipolaricaulota bacterium]